MEVPQKIKNRYVWPNIPTPGYIYPKELKQVSQRYVCIPMVSLALCILTKIQKQYILMSVHGRMDKENMA
jgi:hypothetical protein